MYTSTCSIMVPETVGYYNQKRSHCSRQNTLVYTMMGINKSGGDLKLRIWLTKNVS